VEEFAEKKLDPLVSQTGDLDPLSAPASFPLEADLMNSNREENCLFSRSLVRIFVKPVQSPAVHRSYLGGRIQ